MSSDTPLPDDPSRREPERAPERREVTVRRAPRFAPFMALGVFLGFTAALIVAYTGPVDPTLTRESVLGFFTVAFAIPGLLLGALVVLVLDRRSVRRTRRVQAQRLDDEA
jgi:hypothetical protein